VIARRGDCARRAPAQHFDIAGLVIADRHAFVRQVGNHRDKGIEARHQVRQRRLAGLQIVAQPGDFSHHGRSVLALALQHADLLRQRIAPGLQILGMYLQTLALRFERLEGGSVERHAAQSQALGDEGKIGTKELNVEHFGKPI